MEAGKSDIILKVERTCYTSAKNYQPNVFPVEEKLVNVYLRDVTLMRYPLHGSLHAYRIDFSTKTALHSLVSLIEGQLEIKDYIVRIFLVIEVALKQNDSSLVVSITFGLVEKHS